MHAMRCKQRMQRKAKAPYVVPLYQMPASHQSVCDITSSASTSSSMNFCKNPGSQQRQAVRSMVCFLACFSPHPTHNLYRKTKLSNKELPNGYQPKYHAPALESRFLEVLDGPDHFQSRQFHHALRSTPAGLSTDPFAHQPGN